MSIITAYKSDSDGKLFEHKPAYIAHLKKLSRKRQSELKIVKIKNDKKQFLDDMGNSVKTINDLEQFIVDNWKWFHYNGLSTENYNKNITFMPIVSCKIYVSWKPLVSNTHNCPRNGITNWSPSWNPELPKGYPGWHGTLEIKLTNDKSLSVWDYFSGTTICSGSGSANKMEVLLFDADFPAMAQFREQEEVYKILATHK